MQQAGATRVQADLLQAQLGAGNDAGGDQVERRRGKIGRHYDVRGAQALAAPQARLARREFDVHAERGQHAFGVVAGRVGFHHAGFALRVQAGQQHGRLDLCAGHRRGEVDAMQRLAAMHLQRRRAVVLGIDPCAHLRQRAGDTAHRAAGQRLIADQRAVERLARQQAGQQAHAGAGIAAVQRCLRCFQAVDTDAMHDALRRAGGFDAHTQLAEDARGGAGVLAFQEAFDMRSAIGQRGEHHRAVRDRLVAGNGQAALQRLALAGDPVLRVAHRSIVP